uniref:Uncharacterized protein n=1 Tax=Leersia perrieri TaxID=77586 RepID=A0A0D9WAT3_9ORYZ
MAEKSQISGGGPNRAVEDGPAPAREMMEVDHHQIARYKHALSEFKQSIIVIFVALGLGLGLFLPGALDGNLPVWMRQSFSFSGAWICLAGLYYVRMQVGRVDPLTQRPGP